MSKLVAKFSAYLIAPIIFGALCLSCFIHVAPTEAASIPETMSAMQQDKVCAEYKDSAQIPAVSNMSSAVSTLIISQQHDMSFTEHDTNCRTSGTDVTFDGKIAFSDQYLTIAVMQTESAISVKNFVKQNLIFNSFREKPEKPDFTTGCVIKLE